MVYFFPPNQKIQNIMERLNRTTAIKTDSKLAHEFCQYKEIRYLRKKDKVFIGWDKRKNKSVILLDGIKIRKKGKKYFFDGL